MLIRTHNLLKVFRASEVETTALNRLDLAIETGEFTAVMGPSGCGKSTLLHILGLIDNPTEGEYAFMDENVSAWPESRRVNLRKQHIGFIFQSFNLIDELTVWENVELPLLYTGVPSAARKRKVRAVLDRMNMVHRRKHFPQQLSGGQQQRVAVARAVVNEPKLILADEPTGNLDSEHGREVMKLLLELNEEGHTILMVTHSQAHADVAGRVIRMLDGQVLPEESNSHGAAFG